MKNLRNITISFFVAALLVAPLFSYAQTGPAITKAEMVAMQKKTDAVKKKSQEVKPTDLDLQNQIKEAMTMCGAIGIKLRGISSSKHSTTFTSTFDCFTGPAYDKIPPRDDFSKFLGRSSYSVEAKDDFVQTKLRNLKDEKSTETEFTAKMYNDGTADEIKSITSFATWVYNLGNYLFVGFAQIAASILAFLAATALTVLSYVIDFALGTPNPNIVDRGWVIVRDFMNIFFIVSLIVMALGTILRIDSLSYNSKSFLFNLVVMALLVNFSKVIAETLIDFSDMLISLFKPDQSFINNAKLIFTSFNTGGDPITISGGTGLGAAVGNVITKIIGLTVLTISYIAIAMLMLVRIVGLWFMIMVSPVIYALNVLPNTKDNAKKLWGEFIKFLIWGPVAMFFFKIADVYMQEKSTNKFNDEIIDNLFVAAFVFGGYWYAKKAGMAGSSAIISGTEKAFSKAKQYGKMGAAANGNLWWRGTAPAAVAGAGGYLASKVRLADPGAGTRAYNKTKETVGKTTARIQNVPGNFEQKWIKNPNVDRQKIVDREKRRTQIRRGYFKLDEESAAKLPAADLAYAIQEQKVDEEMLRSVLGKGSSDAKNTVMRAFAEDGIFDKLKAKDGKQFNQLWEDYRNESWKMRGGKNDDPNRLTYLGGAGSAPDKAAILSALKITNKKDYTEDSSFADRVKNTYVRNVQVVREKRTREGRNTNETTEASSVETTTKTDSAEVEKRAAEASTAAAEASAKAATNTPEANAAAAEASAKAAAAASKAAAGVNAGPAESAAAAAAVTKASEDALRAANIKPLVPPPAMTPPTVDMSRFKKDDDSKA